MARPKKTLDCLPKGWQEELIKLASEGGSDVSARCYLNISDDLWYRFIDEEPEFSRTIKDCKQLCQQWWERKGIDMLESGANASIWIFNMKNRFGWRDKSEITGENGKDLFPSSISIKYD